MALVPWKLALGRTKVFFVFQFATFVLVFPFFPQRVFEMCQGHTADAQKVCVR